MSARSLYLDLHPAPHHDINRDSAPSEARAARWGRDTGYLLTLQLRFSLSVDALCPCLVCPSPGGPDDHERRLDAALCEALGDTAELLEVVPQAVLWERYSLAVWATASSSHGWQAGRLAGWQAGRLTGAVSLTRPSRSDHWTRGGARDAREMSFVQLGPSPSRRRPRWSSDAPRRRRGRRPGCPPGGRW